MARVKQEVIIEVHAGLVELEENNPNVFKTCGLCSYQLFESMMDIANTTSAKPMTVCKEFAELYNKDRDERDQVTGRAFYERMRMVNLKEMKSLKSEHVTIKSSENNGQEDVIDQIKENDESKEQSSQDVQEDLEHKGSSAETSPMDVPMHLPKKEVETLSGANQFDENLSETDNQDELFDKTNSRLSQITGNDKAMLAKFYLKGLESIEGYFGFEAKIPHLPIKYLIDEEEIELKLLATAVYDGICKSEWFGEKDLGTFIDHLQQAVNSKS